MAKVTKFEDKRIELDHRAQDRKPQVLPDRWIRKDSGEMVPEPVGPSIFDV